MPVWPPPSPPWAITASTPISSTFSAWRRAPTVGITTTPASWQRATASLVGAPAKLTSRTPSRDHERDPLVEVGLVGPEVHAEGGVGALLHAAHRVAAAGRASW